MTYDHRLVQTATLGGRRSDEPVFLPMERHLALGFRDRHQDATFWCGELLGGCGGQVGVKIYREKVAHFAHHSSTNQCTRQHGGIESADHLFAGKQVNRWLNAQGLPRRKTLFEGDFENGGTCHRLTLPATGKGPAILFEFTERIGPGVRRLLDQGADRPQAWFVRDNTELVHRLTRSEGHALRFRMRTEGFERKVDVGTTSLEGRTWWRPIEECSLEMKRPTEPPAVTLPGKTQQAQAVPVPRSSGARAPGEVLPHPFIGRLRTALEQRKWRDVREYSTRLRQILNTSDIGITRYRHEADELLEVSGKALRGLLPKPVLVPRKKERPTALRAPQAHEAPAGPPVQEDRAPSRVPLVPRQGRPVPATDKASDESRRSGKRKQRGNPTPAVLAQRSGVASTVDENTLRQLQERINTRRL
ncbi:hypothetical protein GCM10009551_040430 [Nocardiopsis tropica]|uniref:competence protein CoiA family protein n=1 Tax=Nocardiopsis tropica TaxID=109330 RepID=UPI0031DA5E21